MKRLLFILICLSMMSSFAGAEIIYNEPNTFPIANEVITLKVFASQDGEHSRADNLQTKELEEKLGIKIDWVIAPTGSFREKLNLLFAGGNAEGVDLILTAAGGDRLDMVTEAQLGAQGLLIPLNEYYDTISVGYKAAFEDLPGFREYITTPDGNIYSMPNVDGSLHVQYMLKLWINTKWLDNLDLDLPRTTEEFYQVLKAFKEQDANGNGDPNDEIPFSTMKEFLSAQIDGFLMAPFQLTPLTTRLYLDGGTVTFSPVKEGYREGLRYLNRLYSEGLINPESFSQDIDNQVNVNENGEDAVIGCFLGLRPGFACDLRTIPNSKKWEQYVSLDPPVGPSGSATAAWDPYTMYVTGMSLIPTGAQNPEAAFRMLDYLATEEGSIRTYYGTEGVHWRRAVEGEVGLDGEPSAITVLPQAATDQNYKWDQLAGLIRNTRFTVWTTTDPDPYGENVAPLNGRQILMYNGSLAHQAVSQPLESVLPGLYFAEDVSEQIALAKTNVMDYTLESIVRFITGDLSLDDDWDAYVQTLHDIGLQEYLDMYQTTYDASAFGQNGS